MSSIEDLLLSQVPHQVQTAAIDLINHLLSSKLPPPDLDLPQDDDDAQDEISLTWRSNDQLSSLVTVIQPQQASVHFIGLGPDKSSIRVRQYNVLPFCQTRYVGENF